MTDTLWEVVPPLPRQVSVNDTLSIAAPTVIVSVPEIALDPDQLPLAPHLLASVLLQVSVVLAPVGTDIGLADRDTVGATAASAGLSPPPHPASSIANRRHVRSPPHAMFS